MRLRRFIADIGWAEKTFDESKTLDENGFGRNNSLYVLLASVSIFLPCSFSPSIVLQGAGDAQILRGVARVQGQVRIPPYSLPARIVDQG